MNDRRMQFAVGVVALGSVFIAVILMMINSPIPSGLLPWGRGHYQLTIHFPSAPGVGPDTPVRKNGVLIGRVASLEDADDGVDVRVNIDKGRALNTDHEAHVRTSVLGDATIDFVTKPTNGDRQPIDVNKPLVGRVDPNPFDAIAKLGDLQDDIQQTMGALTRAGDEVAGLARRVNDAFGTGTEQGRVKRFMDTTETAMDQFGKTMASINQILGDEPSGAVPSPAGQQSLNQSAITGQQLRQRIRAGLNELPDTIHQTNVSMRDFGVVLDSANKNFRNLEGFTEPLGRNGPQIANSIVKAVDGLDRLVEEFTVLTNALNSREGTLGQLIHNPQVYENLNRLTYNANEVVIQFNELMKRLRPIIEDARVFMNKIALEPGRIVRGAVGESSVVK